MHIYIGSDHSGIQQREALVTYLNNKGYQVFDLGTKQAPSNYAQIGISVGEAVSNDPQSVGICICGTGIGISIACNKVKGIRCGLVDKVENASLIKQHNNANVLAMGARTTSLEDMKKIVDVFLKTDFEQGRHLQRINYISDYEANK